MTLPLGHMLRTLARAYNNEESPKKKAKSVPNNTKVTYPCTISGFLSESYGKFGKSDLDYQVILEFN